MKDLDDLIARYSIPPEGILGEARSRVRAAVAEMRRKRDAGAIASPLPTRADNEPFGLREDHTPFPLEGNQAPRDNETPGPSQFGVQPVFRASIVLGIGDDDTIECVAESEHDTEAEARAWVEQQLPQAEFPDWVARRQHGVAGAFLYGQIEQGHYVHEAHADPTFEPDWDVPAWDADLIDGTVRWQPSP